jgi:hypothetical protein
MQWVKAQKQYSFFNILILQSGNFLGGVKNHIYTTKELYFSTSKILYQKIEKAKHAYTFFSPILLLF